jgi:uncharacterized protein (DUF433 family)
LTVLAELRYNRAMLTVADHIEVDDKQIARIAGSRIKVAQLIADHRQWGWAPAEIRTQLPHLTLAQIHAAFVYYYDHKAEIDRQIRESAAVVERMERTSVKGQRVRDQLLARRKK